MESALNPLLQELMTKNPASKTRAIIVPPDDRSATILKKDNIDVEAAISLTVG
jgi:hypothetical protein